MTRLGPLQQRAAISHVAVVVPARDEADRIAATLDSVDVARCYVTRRVSVSIIVVADGCSDATAEAAARRLTHPSDLVEVTEFRSAGAARGSGAWLALAGCDVPHDRLWIASTDADTLVPPDWLQRQLDLADQGFDAVVGTVALRTDEPMRADLLGRFEAEYRRLISSRTDSCHPHIHAANLGLRGDVYLDAGGWMSLATGEEHDLIRRVRAKGWRTVSPADLVVHTSPRLCGRAPSGFAADLRDLDGVS